MDAPVGGEAASYRFDDENENEHEALRLENNEPRAMRARHRLMVSVWTFFFGVLLPILGMMQCEGWNEGSMEVKSCLIDGYVAREYANFLFGIMLISAFMACIPLAFYGCILIALNEVIVQLTKPGGCLRQQQREGRPQKNTNHGAPFQTLSNQELGLAGHLYYPSPHKNLATI